MRSAFLHEVRCSLQLALAAPHPRRRQHVCELGADCREWHSQVLRHEHRPQEQGGQHRTRGLAASRLVVRACRHPRAGIKMGDNFLSVDGIEVNGEETLFAQHRKIGQGATVTFTIQGPEDKTPACWRGAQLAPSASRGPTGPTEMHMVIVVC